MLFFWRIGKKYENTFFLIYSAQIKNVPVLLKRHRTVCPNGINIVAVNTKDLDVKFTDCNFEIDIENVEELRKIMQKVRSMKFVESCRRIINDAKTVNEN